VSLIRSQLQVTISGPDIDGGEIDIRCSLIDQDTSNRKSCPNGQTALIKDLKRAAGLTVEDDGDDTGVFTMPILVQDRSWFESSLSVSHGELSAVEIVTKNQTKSISLALSDAVDSGLPATPYKVDLAGKIKDKTDLEIDLVRSASAPGKLFNSDGDTIYISGSSIPVSGDDLLLRQPVVGSISVEYTVTGQEQAVSISPRAGSVENNYQSTLWVVSSCGEIQHFDIEVPECWQQSWWGDNGFPGNLLGDEPGAGDVAALEPPNYADGEDLYLSWLVCGDKPAADQVTEGHFQDLPGTGPVCHPGVRLSELKNRCGEDGDEWIE
jgi:hypothetical protein